MKKDIYQEVTDNIINLLEKGVVPWVHPYNTAPINLVSGKKYKGINIMLLSHLGYSRPEFATFKQIQNLGGNVRRGEKSHMIVFWKFIDIVNDDGEIKSIPLLRYYNVFNVEQAGGLELKDIKQDNRENIEVEKILDTAKIATVVNDNGIPRYSPSKDVIFMPAIDRFISSDEYYSTLYHEAVHSTGHPDRLNRKTISKVKPFGSPDYSKEELVAELGSAFLCHLAGITKTVETSAAYIDNWIKALSDDKKLIVSASTKAAKAVDYITGGLND